MVSLGGVGFGGDDGIVDLIDFGDKAGGGKIADDEDAGTGVQGGVPFVLYVVQSEKLAFTKASTGGTYGVHR